MNFGLFFISKCACVYLVFPFYPLISPSVNSFLPEGFLAEQRCQKEIQAGRHNVSWTHNGSEQHDSGKEISVIKSQKPSIEKNEDGINNLWKDKIITSLQIYNEHT